jgi:hypothetical protein
MPPSDQPRSPGLRQRLARRLARIVLLALLVAIGLLTYLHQVGLPDFAREALIRELRTQGIELDCGRIGLRWYRGIVAEQVSWGQTASADGPEILLPEVAFRLHVPSLLRLRPVVKSLELRGGHFVLPLHPEGAAVEYLTLKSAEAELRFAADGTWRLDRFSADSLGFKVHLRGTLTNGSALRAWRGPVRPDSTPAPWEQTLRRLLTQMQRLEFEQPPHLTVEFLADATRLEATRGSVRLDAGRARSPWGSLETLQASLLLQPWSEAMNRAGFELALETRGVESPVLKLGSLRINSQWSQSLSRALPEDLELKVALDEIDSPWVSLAHLNLAGSGRHDIDQPHLVHLELALDSGALAGGGGESEDNELVLRWVHDLEQATPHHGDWQLRVRSPRFDWGQADLGTVQGRFARSDTPPTTAGDGLPPGWQWLTPWTFDVKGQFERLAISSSVLDRVEFEAAWDPPTLALRSIEVDLLDRRLRAALACQALDRKLTGNLAFDFDVRRLDQLLPPAIHEWLEPYGWQPGRPPHVRAQLWLTLPPWTDIGRPEAWSAVEETLGVQGTLVAAPGAYRGVPMDSVVFDFQFTNAVWRLTDFVATAPEGRLGMTYTEDQRTGNYRFDLDARLDPRAFRPLVPPTAQTAFDYFEFSQPPAVEGHIAGCWRASGQTGFGGSVQLGPLRFRGEPIDEFEARLDYTNGVVRGTGVRLRSEGWITAEAIEFDLEQQRLSFLEAQSSVPPMRVARAIGDEVVRTLSPYIFDQPPQARVDGWLNVQDTREAGMRFELAGGPFRYWLFQLPRIQGVVGWSNEVVRIENLQAPFYDGHLSGYLDVDLTAAEGADLSFHTRIESADFQRLMADLLSPTNRLEGRLSGSWTLTHANSEDWNSWNGLGQVELKDGFLWDLSLLGGFSELMDRLKIEVGRNPIKGLTADFTMTNSLIHTRNLQLQSAAMRLDYRGTFDFDGGVNARVEARLLHNTAVVGPLVSLLFSPLTKIFEFKVTGTLGAPKLEPLYFPKPLLFPLNPIGTLKDLFQRPSFQGPDP